MSLPTTFVPVLAAPAPIIDAQRPRVSGWVFVAAFVAFIAPVIAVVAVHETRTPATHVGRASTTAIETTTETSTIPSTRTSTSTSATPEAPRQEPNLHHEPRTKPITTTTTTTTVTVKHEAPKCCPGETEMQCAMRRSVGATCG